jgi:serine/threonine protein kinase/tetratricopeptide (TPR) repeat protein
MVVDAARAKSLFLAASDVADPAERAAFLDRECGGDAELRARVEALLKANDAAPLPAVPQATVDPAPGQAETADYGDPTARVGALLAGKYKLIEEIGEGGMGSVFLAQQTAPVKRAVAVKVIKAGMDSKAVLARFEAERQALAMMDHSNIARVLDAGTTDGGRPFFVMELVKGVPITRYCDDHKLTPRQRLELFVPVCQAIQHAHQKGIIHRDIKPSNVLVAAYDDRAVPKVIDFGVAKAAGQTLTDQTLMTGFGTVVGTPEYMSPEQASLNNLDIDTRSDVYSLGVLLYELLTGTTPVDKKSLGKAALLEILRIVREVEAPRPSAKLSTIDTLPNIAANRGTEPARLSRLMRGELDCLVLKALEKDRTRRYDTANGLARDIQRYLADEVVEARPPSVGYRLSKFVRRHKGEVLAASLVLLTLVAGVIGTSLALVQAKRAAAAERLARDDAVEQKGLAEQAAAQQRLAKREADAKRKEAETNLTFAKKGNEILGSVFAGLDPKANHATVADLRNALRDNLNKAVKDLEGSAIGDPLDVAAMQNTLGLSLLGLGEASLAVKVFEKALTTRKAKLGPDHHDTLASTNNLAFAYQTSGQLARAVTLLEATLEKTKARLGPDHPDTFISMNNLAGAYMDSGQLARAVTLYEETVEKSKAKLGPDHPSTLSTMGNLARAYHTSGQHAKAVPLLEATLPKMKAKLGPDHPHTLTSMGTLASAYQASNQLARAVPLYEETLPKMKAKFGPDHPDTLTNMHNLASAYQASGQLARAVPLYEETLAKMKAKLGPDHPNTLTSMGTLAGAYGASGQHARAVTLLEVTLQKQKAKLGPDHPNTLTSMNNLALAYQANGQFARAVTQFKETLEKSKVKLGPDHPTTLSSMNNLAVAYQASGQLARAVSLFKETLEKIKAKLGPDHPTTLNSMNNLANAYYASGQLARAVTLFKETLEKIKAKLGPDHPTTLASMGNLAGAYAASGQLAKAVPLLEVTLQKKKVKLGPDHPDTLTSMNNLAFAYQANGQHAKAVPLYEETLAKRKAKLGPDHPSTLTSMNNLAVAYQATGQLAKAVPLFKEALEKGKAKLGAEHPQTLGTMASLGSVLLGQKKYAEAEPLLLKGYEGMKTREKTIPKQGGGELRIPEALDRLIELYTAINKPDEAKKWQAERAKYPQGQTKTPQKK